MPHTYLIKSSQLLKSSNGWKRCSWKSFKPWLVSFMSAKLTPWGEVIDLLKIALQTSTTGSKSRDRSPCLTTVTTQILSSVLSGDESLFAQRPRSDGCMNSSRLFMAAQTGQWRRVTVQSDTLTSQAVTQGDLYIFDKHLGLVGKLRRANLAYLFHFAPFIGAHDNTKEPHSRWGFFSHREPEFWWNDNRAAGCYRLPQTNGGSSYTGIPRLNNRRNRRHLEADRPVHRGSRL